jgi:hypothetical protein
MDLTGVQLDKYHVVEQIDTGGMAEVYKAYQPDLDRYVAIKVITSDLGSDPMFLEQFEREARMLAQLEHPNILPIYDSGRYGDTPYLVTQYVQEGTLADRMGRPLPPEEAVRIVCQVGDALSYAHAKGIIHRDVKPANVLFTKSGNVLLADFGIAQAIESQRKASARASKGSGTPAYMAPEQRAGKPVDGRADIYAMGVVLYELLTGRSASKQNILARTFTGFRIPAPLVEVIECATMDRPDNRHQVAEDFVAAVQESLLKISGEYVGPSALKQQALEAVIIAMFVLVGVGLSIFTVWLLTRPGSLDTWSAGFLGSFIWMGSLMGSLICLANAAVLIFRDRTRPLSMALLGTIGLIVAGGTALVIPLGLGFEFVRYGMMGGGTLAAGIGNTLLCALPGVVLLGGAFRLYTYHHRQARISVPQSIQPTSQSTRRKSPAFAAQHARLVTRKTSKDAFRTLLVVIVFIVIAGVVVSVAPEGSTTHGLAVSLLGALIYTTIIMVVVFIVWYAFSKITTPSADSTGQSPSEFHAVSNRQARRARLEKAREYQALIKRTVAQAREGPLRERLKATTQRLDDWIAYIERLTLHLNKFEHDPIIRRNLGTVPRAVHMLEARIALDQDTSTGVKRAVHRTLAARQTQLHNLRTLERLMIQAELYSEETVAALGTIYSQLLLVEARDVHSPRVQRLRVDIDEQVQALSDLLDAIGEIQGERPDS